MINFLNTWVEQIVISVIVVSIFELILPKGNLKKYIKVVLSIYIIFCIISPFANGFNMINTYNLKLEENLENTSKSSKTTRINKQTMDERINQLYIDELKKDIEKKLGEYGYEIEKIKIDADFNKSGISKINLIIRQEESKITTKKIEIDLTKEEKVKENEKTEEVRELIANTYQINKDIIKIKLK